MGVTKGELTPELAEALTRKANAEAAFAEAEAAEAKMKLANYKATNDQNRVLVLSGAILDTEDVINTLLRWSRRDPKKPITIMLNTPGGDVIGGNALVATIKELRKAGHHVTIIGSGAVMSYGAVLLQAADERVLDADVIFMLHSLNTPLQGSLESLMDSTKMLQEVQDRLLNALADRATISKTRIKQLIKRKELFLSAQDALKYGFCDKVG